MITLIRLKREGALTTGDTIRHERIGLCTVVAIPSLHNLIVRRVSDGQHFNMSGLNFRGATLGTVSA